MTIPIVIAGLAVAAVATAPILAGFGTAGILAGSAAAGIQSSIGAVSAGSLFATLTSWGMQGYFASTAVGGAITAAIGALL